MEETNRPYRGAVFVTPEFPWPSTSGARVRAAGIADALGVLGSLVVLALDSSEADELWLRGVNEHRRRRAKSRERALDVGRGLVCGRHVVLERAEHAGLPAALGGILRKHDPSIVVLGRPLWGNFVDEARRADLVVIADADESQKKVSRSILRSRAPLTRRGRALLDLLSAARMERGELARVDQIWVSSADEIRSIQADAAGVSTVLIPNATRLPLDPPSAPVQIGAIGFVGYFAHPPNEAAALELIATVMPAIREAGGPRRLVLIGREPTSRMQRAAAIDGEVTITGEVPNPAAALREAGVLVMPIRSGGGTRVKALEAVAAGVPIVSTAFGVEGLDLRPGLDVLTAETSAEFADALRRLDDGDLRKRLVGSAFERLRRFNSAEAQRDAVRAAVRLALPLTTSAASFEMSAFGNDKVPL